MHMSNLFPVERLRFPVMAAKSPRFGIHHLTVVPSNFEPEQESEANESESEADESATDAE